MKPLVSILTPTRGRPQMMARFVKSALDTAKCPDRIEFLIWVDNDDPFLSEYAQIFGNMKEVKLFVGQMEKSDVVGGIWNYLAERCHGQNLMMGNDDLMCTSKGWDNSLDNTVRRYADKIYVAWFDDGINGQNHCAFPIVSRKWYEILGYFVPEDFMFFCHDTYLFHMARDLGRLLFIPDRLEHWHHSTDKMERDDTTKRNRGKNQSQKDIQKLVGLEKSARWRQELASFRAHMLKSPYVKDKRLDRFLSGKRVALVGPAGTLMSKGLGMAIDQYDIVCRVNEVSAFGFEADYGTRTDIIFHSCAGPTMGNLVKSLKHDSFVTDTIRTLVGVQLEKCENDNRLANLSDTGRQFKIQTHHIMNPFWQYVADQLRASPNTGTMAIRTLLEYDITELLITGFDFYTGGEDVPSHHPAYLVWGGDDLKPEKRVLHDQGEQLRYLRNNVLPVYGDKVVLDSRIHELVERKTDRVFRLDAVTHAPGYKTHDLLAELVNGKDVVIVGPSPHLEGSKSGKKIDQYDVVCRVNELMSFGQEKDYGSRTDIVFHCCGEPSLQKYVAVAREHPEAADGVKLLVCPQAVETKHGNMKKNWCKSGLKTPFHHVGQIWWYRVNQEVGVASNTGFLAIILLLKEYNLKSLHVTGFSFYSQGLKPEERHSKSYRKYGGDDTAKSYMTPSGQCGHRNQMPQLEYLVDKLLPSFRGTFSVDDFLMDIIEKHRPCTGRSLRTGSIYAVYRCLYGAEFIEKSIRSVLHIADRVFVYWTNKPFAGVWEVEWEGVIVKLPDILPDITDVLTPLVEEFGERVVVCYDHWGVPDNQFTHLINDRLLGDALCPDYVICMEPDMVWKKDQLKKAYEEFTESKLLSATLPQVELWKTPEWCIPSRPKRIGPVFFNMKDKYRHGVPETGKSGNTKDMGRLEGCHVHNFGFCVQIRTMFLKHILALGFSREIKDSQPNEKWFFDKWVTWDPETNNVNLEISEGREHTISKAIPYEDELPEVFYE